MSSNLLKDLNLLEEAGIKILEVLAIGGNEERSLYRWFYELTNTVRNFLHEKPSSMTGVSLVKKRAQFILLNLSSIFPDAVNHSVIFSHIFDILDSSKKYVQKVKERAEGNLKGLSPESYRMFIENSFQSLDVMLLKHRKILLTLQLSYKKGNFNKKIEDIFRQISNSRNDLNRAQEILLRRLDSDGMRIVERIKPEIWNFYDSYTLCLKKAFSEICKAIVGLIK